MKIMLATLGVAILSLAFTTTASAQGNTLLTSPVIMPPEKVRFEGPPGDHASGVLHQGANDIQLGFLLSPVGPGSGGNVVWEGVLPPGSPGGGSYVTQGPAVLVLTVRSSSGPSISESSHAVQMVDPMHGPMFTVTKRKVTASCTTQVPASVSLEVTLMGANKKDRWKGVAVRTASDSFAPGPCELTSPKVPVKRCKRRFKLCQTTGTVSSSTVFEGMTYPLGPEPLVATDSVTFKGEKKK